MTHENAANSQFPFIFQGNDSWSNEWRGSKLCRAVGQWSTLALLESTLRKCMPRDAGSVRSFDENYWSSPASKGPIRHLSLECLDFFRTDQLQDLHLKKRRVLFRLTFSLGCLHADAPGSLVVSKREAKARAKARRERTRPGPLNQRGVCFVLLLQVFFFFVFFFFFLLRTGPNLSRTFCKTLWPLPVATVLKCAQSIDPQDVP